MNNLKISFLALSITLLMGHSSQTMEKKSESHVTEINITESQLLDSFLICSLCEEGENTIVLNCNHYLCNGCFEAWQKKGNTCPTCRGPFEKAFRTFDDVRNHRDVKDLCDQKKKMEDAFNKQKIKYNMLKREMEGIQKLLEKHFFERNCIWENLIDVRKENAQLHRDIKLQKEYSEKQKQRHQDVVIRNYALRGQLAKLEESKGAKHKKVKRNKHKKEAKLINSNEKEEEEDKIESPRLHKREERRTLISPRQREIISSVIKPLWFSRRNDEEAEEKEKETEKDDIRQQIHQVKKTRRQYVAYLYAAIKSDSPEEIIKLFQAWKFVIDAKIGHLPPVLIALFYNKLEALDTLLKLGAKFDDWYIHHAKKAGDRPEAVALLMDYNRLKKREAEGK